MHKGMMRAFRNTAYMNLDTGEVTKKKSVARGWEEDGYDVDEVVVSKARECYCISEDAWDNWEYECDSFRTAKA